MFRTIRPKYRQSHFNFISLSDTVKVSKKVGFDADIIADTAMNNLYEVRENTADHPDINISKDKIFSVLNSSIRRTKIVCTIGPACNKEEILVKMIENGMTVARLNFSHGDHAGHLKSLETIRKAYSHFPDIAYSIMLDTKGPEIRTGVLTDHKNVELKQGQELEITQDYSFIGNSKKISCSYPHLVDLKPGQMILIADGTIETVVVKTLTDGVVVVVLNNAVIGERKNMCLPGVEVKLPILSEKDVDDLLNFGVKHGVDMISASFIRKDSDVVAIRKVLGEEGKKIKIISKIENHEGLQNYEKILAVSDGIMVARGDMGMEIPLEKVFIAQKWMIDKANIAGKPIITATQLLESMCNNPRPTRAETTDVANAVLDGTDAVMLSGETAGGKFPVEAVKIMGKICVEAESCINHSNIYNLLRDYNDKNSLHGESICSSAVKTAMERGAKAIFVITHSGSLAHTIAKYKPSIPIYALCYDEKARAWLSLSWGVSSFVIAEKTDSIEQLITYTTELALKKGVVVNGDKYVFVMSVRQGIHSGDLIKLVKVTF